MRTPPVSRNQIKDLKAQIFSQNKLASLEEEVNLSHKYHHKMPSTVPGT